MIAAWERDVREAICATRSVAHETGRKKDRMPIHCATIRKIAAALVVAAPVGVVHGADDWTHLAANPRHAPQTINGPTRLGDVCWHAEPNAAEEYIGLASPVVWDQRVFVAARRFDAFDHVATLLIAYHAESGERLWTAIMPPDQADSWSSPAVDVARGRVLYPSAAELFAFDAANGNLAWSTPLSRTVVNASPTVAGDRVLITDAKGFGSGSRLYAINAAPTSALMNPYALGEVIWSTEIGASTGATPTVVGESVYVANIDGEVIAFDIADGGEQWRTDVAAVVGAQSGQFFSGLTARDGALYGATYNFSGGVNSAWLVKLDRATGDLVWQTPCARTRSMPAVTTDGRIFLAGGIAGFGAQITVQAFEDLGSSGAKVWDIAAEAPGLGAVGGWTAQPVFSRGVLFVGAPAPPGDFFGPFERLHAIRADATPLGADFIAGTVEGAGGACAISGQRLFSIGVDGLLCIDGSDALRRAPNRRGPAPARWQGAP